MINTEEFVNLLREKGISLFVGVPDSLLKEFSGYLIQYKNFINHIITANEGNAIGIAIGHYLSTKKPAVVYMQNSGLGNIVNPITSLADEEVYNIPMILIIGWRGQNGVKDEPQHKKQGKITLSQLDILGIPYRIIDSNSNIKYELSDIFKILESRNTPVALVVRKDTFSPIGYVPDKKPLNWPVSYLPLQRESAIECILQNIPNNACVIATTGKTGRELFELRAKRGEIQRDFLSVGGMGHASSIALGVAIASPKRLVVCLDGDGAILMHMGALPVIGATNCHNFLHILLNNQSYESVGGQPSVAISIKFRNIVISCGYTSYQEAYSINEIKEAIELIIGKPGSHFIEIHIWQGSRKNLGRPTSTPIENKIEFMKYLEKE